MHRGLVALVVILLLATVGLVSWYRSGTSDHAGVDELGVPRPVATGSSSTTTTVVRRHDPDDLGVVLDPDGRPYDATTRDPDRHVRLETEVITTMRLPDGEVLTMGGEYVPSADDPWDEGSQSTLDTDRVTVTMIWETWERDGEQVRIPLGLRLDAPGAAVSQWGRLEYAYGTDGGMGGVASSTWAAAIEEVPDDERDALLDRFVDGALDYDLFDLDGRDGTDALVFGNGWGDGGFPKTTGYSSDGDAVSLVIWRPDHPWRLAFPEGTPPPEITEREEELQECLDGERGVDEHGWCVADGEPW